MGSPRDITGDLTGWAARHPEHTPAPEARKPRKVEPGRFQEKQHRARPERRASIATRATDYFSVFVYSLLTVSLGAQGLIILVFSVF
jgi:hypothetical protein